MLNLRAWVGTVWIITDYILYCSNVYCLKNSGSVYRVYVDGRGREGGREGWRGRREIGIVRE